MYVNTLRCVKLFGRQTDGGGGQQTDRQGGPEHTFTFISRSRKEKKCWSRFLRGDAAQKEARQKAILGTFLKKISISDLTFPPKIP